MKLHELLYREEYDYAMESKYAEEVCGMLDRFNVTHKMSHEYYIPGFDTFRIVTVSTSGNIWLVVNKIDEKLEHLRERDKRDNRKG